MLHNLVRDYPGRNFSGPSHEQWNPECTLPVRIFLAAERGHRAVGPGVHVRAVVGRVDDDRAVSDPQFVQQIKHFTDVLVVVNHGVVIGRLVRSSLPQARRLGVRTTVHVRRV